MLKLDANSATAAKEVLDAVIGRRNCAGAAVVATVDSNKEGAMTVVEVREHDVENGNATVVVFDA